MGRGVRQVSPAGRAGVTRDHIVDVALEVLESEGPDGLTMRRLASKLGVAATAIYWHVGDKHALLDAVVDRITARLGEVHVEGARPAVRIVSTGRSLRRNLLEQPYLIGVVHEQGRTAEIFDPARTVLSAELVGSGLEEGKATLAVEAIIHHVVGSVLIDQQVARAPTQRASREKLVDPDELFEFTLTTMVRAFTTDR